MVRTVPGTLGRQAYPALALHSCVLLLLVPCCHMISRIVFSCQRSSAVDAVCRISPLHSHPYLLRSLRVHQVVRVRVCWSGLFSLARMRFQFLDPIRTVRLFISICSVVQLCRRIHEQILDNNLQSRGKSLVPPRSLAVSNLFNFGYVRRIRFYAFFRYPSSQELDFRV